MRRRAFMTLAAGIAALALHIGALRFARSTPGQQTEPVGASVSQPNVVLISMDTTRADHLGCYGYGKSTSPNLAHLAARGVRFANAHSQAPWTIPSHMTLLTSMLPSHNGVNQESGMLPRELPTLAEILKNYGYYTAGLVNNGNVATVWGFSRGFRLWQEFAAAKPEGNCVNVTNRAVQWLEQAPSQPFFLFLHYFDPHTPYDPPDEYRQRFGSTLTGFETETIVSNLHFPNKAIVNREEFDQVIGSYDGEIAWVDHELGRLFAALPPNTLVVLVSDHGEGFKEHGWTSHGGTLYEELTHVPLLMSFPGVLPEDVVVEDPAMLLDVAPTILGVCGVPSPPHFEGMDLSPTWNGARLPERLVLGETMCRGGQMVLKSVALDDWKLIRSVCDGREELYHLPDEQTDLSHQESALRSALAGVADRWIGEEEFWMAYVRGPGNFQVSLVPHGGQVLNHVAVGDGKWCSNYELEPNGKFLRWTCNPHDGIMGTSFMQIVPADASVRLDVSIDGRHQPDKVFIGPSAAHPKQLPLDLDMGEIAASDPVIDKPFQPARPGFYLFHHRSKTRSHFPTAPSATLDDKTIHQLKSLGYLR